MKKLFPLLILTAFFSINSLMTIAQDDTLPKPPVARKVPKITEIHGDKLVDNYFWLRTNQKNPDPEVITYLEAENKYTEAMMKPLAGFQDTLYQEMLGRIQESDLSVPVKDGSYYYYSRTEKGKQYGILCRKKGSLNAAEEIYLDINQLAEGKKFMSIGDTEISDSEQLLAYTADNTGYRQYTLAIRDLKTGKLLPDTAERVTSLVWAADNKTLFYVQEDAVTKRSDKLFRKVLGNPKDELLYEEKDELYDLGMGRSRSKAYIFLISLSKLTTEARYLAADRPNDSFRVIAPREGEHQYFPDHHGKHFYIRTNDKGRNFRLVKTSVSDPARKNWEEVIAHRDSVMLEGMNFFEDYYILSERENGLNKMRVTEFKTGQLHYIDFPEPVYSAFPNANPEFKTTKFRFGYQSFITPSSIFDYDLKTRKRELLKEQPVLGGYDRKQYQSERIYATAKDGTKIPVSIVYKKGLKRDGGAPMLLYAYGSYGLSSSVGFNSGRLSLLDRGMIYALAHIRGGGDMGKIWHEQGRMLTKKNTFTDFINCAEHLIAEKYTAKDRLVIEGGSAGGLLMGAVTNMRPDLFKAVLSHVPFVDVISTMLDASIPLTTSEYIEWGNPNDKQYYTYMKSYSPYDNIEAKSYPTMLVTTSLNDSQVAYWEPAKYVARMRAMKTDNNVLMLKTNMGAGHGGASGRYDRLKEVAFNYSFALSQVGITK
jgi:oligopeptidase B